MNYYPFHLGDYAAHTAHLEPMEDLAYRRMLDLYYRTEKVLPCDVSEIARLIRMRDDEATIRDVLNEFFTRTDAGWSHVRCDAELSKMQDKQAKAKASAQASVNARSTNAQRTLNERSTDAELPTPTPIPVEKKPTAAPWLTVPDLVADGLSQTLSADWLAHRRTRKAKLTRLAWDGFKAEVSKAGWQLDDAIRKAISRNWTAFEAEWVKPAGFQAVAAVTVPSIAADKTAELLKADEEHRAEVARQRALRQQEKAA